MKHSMSSKGWLLAFAGTVLLLVLLIMGFNFWTDPFGAFGDRFFQWWSYDETMNPRVAKLSYLEQNHEQYDSYVIGASHSSSYPTEALNTYFDAKFYNLIMYGADMKDVELTSQYVIEHYTVKNLVVSVYIHNAETYDTEANPLTYNLHYKVDGSSPLLFYAKYLLADPRIGLEKLQRSRTDPYLQQSYRVFDPETGAYDKSSRDVEPIGDLSAYLARAEYAAFTDYPTASTSIAYLEQCMESLARIKQMCQEAGVNLVVVCPPMYYAHLAQYSPQDQAAFYNALAEVTDYWDFTLSSVSYDPRYFYDTTHFRNCVGEMLLAKMFDDTSVYAPADLGRYVAQGQTPGQPQAEVPDVADYTASVPILVYHNLAETGEGSDTMSVERFTQHMAALQEAGYASVTFDDLRRYVEQGTPLPEKPVVITFDDGYESNYTLAYPILQQYNMKATFFVIGVSVGKDTYKDTGQPILPHFSLEQAQEMVASGLITIQSHGYDIHQAAGLEEGPVRQGILPLEGETEEDYIRYLRQDCQKMEELLGYTPGILAYPGGNATELSEVILSEMGIWCTLTIVEKTNTIIQGMPQSLRQLGRYYMKESITASDLIRLLEE